MFEMLALTQFGVERFKCSPLLPLNKPSYDRPIYVIYYVGSVTWSPLIISGHDDHGGPTTSTRSATGSPSGPGPYSSLTRRLQAGPQLNPRSQGYFKYAVVNSPVGCGYLALLGLSVTVARTFKSHNTVSVVTTVAVTVAAVSNCTASAAEMPYIMALPMIGSAIMCGTQMQH